MLTSRTHEENGQSHWWSANNLLQAEEFALNVEDEASSGYSALSGHGFDGTLACGLVRCPEYDATYVTNLGTRYELWT